MTAFTHHGGRVDQAAIAFPDAPTPWLDLSTGINPEPWWPAAAIEPDLGPLPTPSDLAALERVAAAYFEAPPERVAAVPGSEIALRMLDRLGLPAPYRHVAPGYRSHRAACPLAIAEVRRDTGTTVFANPNNPDGRVIAADAIRALAGDGWLVVDEAFADCDPASSVAGDLPDRTVVLRSFGKFFGLAGLRLGFVIAPRDVTARVRMLLGDWPVSTLAIAYGVAAYADAGWIAATRTRLAAHAAALDALLGRHGLRPTGDCPLFRLVESERPLFGQLARAGILTRPFDDHPRWTRIGLPRDDADLLRLDRALDG